ncbi:hypothetical protein ACH4PU_30790 [Streptomyces sp. NPDC021100]|uniref:hypothetical protein n=1 Tax=Streptomyces sp. NPDC021100 TaxID=3365114 RepID=UPI003793D7F3
MSHGSTLSQQARYRARCTGLGHQAQLQFLSRTRPAVPVPAAGNDQALLEAALLEGIDGIVGCSAHPAGIQSVLPRPDHLTARLDLYLGGRERMLPAHSLERLLPTHYTGPDPAPGSVGGTAGIRLLRIDEDGLHLGLVGSSASATLTGPTSAQWRACVADHRSWCAENQLEPLWDSAVLTEPEIALRAEHPLWERMLTDSAWLGSGLLRRIGLFHTVCSAYWLRYWYDGEDWKIDLSYEHGVPADHDALVEHLVHPVWGLPLRVDHRHCECRPCECDGGRERQCAIELAPVGNRCGGVSFRFRSAPQHRDLSTRYTRLLAAGAGQGWLQRSLPRHHRQAEASTTACC